MFPEGGSVYHYKAEIATLQNEKRKLEYDMNELNHSVSFRVGRAATFIPRKLRDVVRRIREHDA